MLKLQELSFSTPKRAILHDISFSLKPGEILVITGPNGSGKSTLAKLIAGIEKPSAGTITFKQTDITKLSCTERARQGIAFSFQQPVHFKGLTVQDILQIAVTGESALYGTAPQNLGKYLRRVGLTPEHYLNREINQSLSGGELKRIEIASVIARPASLVIFDEPEAGIDIWSFSKLIRIFQSLHQSGRSVIIISHQPKVLAIADRIIVLKDGKIAQSGPASKIIAKLEPQT